MKAEWDEQIDIEIYIHTHRKREGGGGEGGSFILKRMKRNVNEKLHFYFLTMFFLSFFWINSQQ